MERSRISLRLQIGESHKKLDTRNNNFDLLNFSKLELQAMSVNSPKYFMKGQVQVLMFLQCFKVFNFVGVTGSLPNDHRK